MEGSRAARRRPPQRRSQRGRSDTGARVLAAIPAIAFAIFIVSQGGLVFTIGLIVLGIVAMGELFHMMERVRPAALAGFLALAGMCLAALYGDQYQVLLVLVASVPVTFLFTLLRPRREPLSWAIAVVLFGIVWIGLPISHAVLLRELPHGGGLLLDVL